MFSNLLINQLFFKNLQKLLSALYYEKKRKKAVKSSSFYPFNRLQFTLGRLHLHLQNAVENGKQLGSLHFPSEFRREFPMGEHSQVILCGDHRPGRGEQMGAGRI